ncbi:MAG: ATP-binding protein [Myxococcota bacterium]|nr:ATP-binding protein [Myxococcota bacterium]
MTPDRPSAWSIRRRLLLTLAVVFAVLLLVSGQPVRQMETDVMTGILREQYAGSLESMAPAIQDHVITQDADLDLPVLQRIVADFHHRNPEVLSVRIEGADGHVLVEERGELPAEEGKTFEVSRVLKAGDFTVGRVEIVVDLRDLETQVARHVLRLQALFAVLLLLVMFVVVAPFYRFTVRPLRLLDEKLRKLVSGEEIPDEKFAGSEEFLRLNDSVDALASAVQLQEKQKELEQQLQQSQKLEAIGRLAGGVAHDFNNLLTVILGYAETLAQDPSQDEKTVNSASQIVAAGERAAALTRQLLAFSRKQVLRSSVIDPVEVLSAMEEMLRRLIGELIVVRVEVADRVGYVDVDPNQLEQVLLNLAVNARDAMRRGGHLSFRLSSVVMEVQDASRPGEPVPVPPGEYVLLEVEDDGCGMNEETLARVFEPFFTTKGAGEGTGLGLAMVYGIVTQSGGYLDLSSEPGEGTTFRIYLPRVEAREEPVPEERIETRNSEGGTILLVEDEALVRTLACEILEGAGYDVLTATDSREAVDLSAGHSGEIHLLLTDLVLPGMSGVDLSRVIREHRPDIRTLLVSGYDNGLLGPEERTLPFLQKPFDRSLLLERVSEVILSGH